MIYLVYLASKPELRLFVLGKDKQEVRLAECYCSLDPANSNVHYYVVSMAS